MTNIFEYTNFREYLRDYFKEAKKENSKFTHRYLAQKLELSTSNLIWRIIQGKRNLTKPVMFKLSQFLSHSKKETQYFENMVSFLQAKTHDEKNLYFKRMIELRHNLKIKKIDEQQYEYYSNWYNLVVRELVTYPDFNDDFIALAKKLSPPITLVQAKQSVELLLKQGLIKKNGKRYVQKDPVISTGPEINSLAVVNFHRKMAHLAAESYDRHTKKERTITSCTVNISEDRFQDLKREIADFRRKALMLADDANKSSRVFQLNIQLFPLSKAQKEE